PAHLSVRAHLGDGAAAALHVDVLRLELARVEMRPAGELQGELVDTAGYIDPRAPRALHREVLRVDAADVNLASHRGRDGALGRARERRAHHRAAAAGDGAQLRRLDGDPHLTGIPQAGMRLESDVQRPVLDPGLDGLQHVRVRLEVHRPA